MITVNHILKLVSDALQTKNFELFSAKFSEIFYDIENTGDPEAIKLSYQIESKLADVSAGVASEKSLENFLYSKLPLNVPAWAVTLSSFATFYVIPYSLCPINSWAGAESSSAAFDISSSGECGSVGLLPRIHQTSTALPHRL